MMKRILPAALLLLATLPVIAQAQNAWTNTFTIEIFKRPLPEIPTNSVDITVVQGSTASGSIELQNNGNIPVSFTAVRDPDINATSLGATWKPLQGWVEFLPNPDRDIPDTPTSVDLELPTFPYLNLEYRTAQIYNNGSMQLDFAFIFRPFFGNVTIDRKNIRYLQDGENGRFIASWEGASTSTGLHNLYFQVQLYDTGEVRYLYKSMDGATINDATVGYESVVLEEEAPNLDLRIEDSTVPLANNSMLVLTPKFWINPASGGGSVQSASTTLLTFVADATGSEATSGSYEFIVTWADGTEETVTVNVTVESAAPALTVTPASHTFSGPAGSITKDTTVELSNTGNVDVNYSIVMPGTQNIDNYTWTENSPFIYEQGTHDIEFVPYTSAANDGFSDLLPLGFAFPYFGNLYTNFSVDIEGFITLGAAGFSARQIIAPLLYDLYYDGDSHIYSTGDRYRHFITWEKMRGPNGHEQSFRLVLERNGTITFQYFNLGGTNQWITSNLNDTLKYRDYLRRPNAYGGNNVGDGPEPHIPTEVKHFIGLLDGWNVAISGRNATLSVTRSIQENLIWEDDNPESDLGTVSFKDVVTETSVTNIYSQDQFDALDPKPRDSETTPVAVNGEIFYSVVTTTIAESTVPVYDDPLQNQAFAFVTDPTPITVSPLIGSLSPGESQQLTLTGDARGLSNGDSETVSYSIQSEGAAKTLTATFNVIAASPAALAMDSDGDGQSDLAEFMAGTDAQDAGSTFRMNLDGSRTISWTTPSDYDGLPRTYVIEYTTNLLGEWTKLAEVTDETSFTDEQHNDEPVIYYKVTVK